MPRPRRPIPDEDAQVLRRLTRRIRGIETAINERGALMVRLQDDGYSVGSIAAATDANEEGVRRAIARHRSRTDKAPPRQPEPAGVP